MVVLGITLLLSIVANKPFSTLCNFSLTLFCFLESYFWPFIQDINLLDSVMPSLVFINESECLQLL